MIRLEGVSARDVRPDPGRGTGLGGPLADVTAEWAEGVHALLGGGSSTVLRVVAGVARARSGVVRVLGGDPRDPAVAPRIAYVPLHAVLPDGLRVGEVLDLATAIRGGSARPAGERLAVLGVESLARLPVKVLAPPEIRAVALSEAITSSATVVLVEEPLVSLEPRAVPRLAEALRARANEGVAVLVATASVRDARDLADDHAIFRAGALVGRADSLADLAEFSPSGARVRIVTSDPAALAAALARELAVEAVARDVATVRARGRSARELARAAAQAVVASGVDVVQMRFEPPSLEEAKAASEGVAAATYQMALERTRAQAARAEAAARVAAADQTDAAGPGEAP